MDSGVKSNNPSSAYLILASEYDQGLLRSKGKIELLKSSGRQVIIFYIALMPVIDSLNGLIIKSNAQVAVSIGAIYRLSLVFFLLLMSGGSFKRRQIMFLIATVALMLIAVFVHLAIYDIVPIEIGMLADFKSIIQWLYAPIMCVLFYSCVKNGSLRANNALDVFRIMAYAATATLILPYCLGIGYSTYGTSNDSYVGYKAFYYATNGVTFLLICCFSFAVRDFIVSRKIEPFVRIVLCTISIILVGTKSGLVMLAVSTLVCYFIFNSKRKGVLAIKMLRLFIILIGTSIVLYLLFQAQLAPVFDRAVYFLGKSENFLSFVTSGRVDRIPGHFETLQSMPPIATAFGIGQINDTLTRCEMDYFDIFFEFGIVGLSILISFSVYAVKKRHKSELGTTCRAFLIISLFYSFFVGHVFSNALSATCFSLLYLGMQNASPPLMGPPFLITEHLRCEKTSSFFR